MNKINRARQILILILLSYLFFMLGNGILSLTNPDEVFYAQTAKEMIQHKTWMTPYLFDKPQFEKPVLTYWLLKLSFILFGVSSFSARLFPALFAALGVISVYFLGLWGFKNEKKAFLSSLILMSSGLYVGLARTLFTDMIFSVLILLSVTSFYFGYSFKNRKGLGLLLFFIFSGLATLTKGPLGFFIPFLIIVSFLLLKRDIKFLFCWHFLWGLFIFTLVTLPWYVFMVKRYGNSFVGEFFYNDHIRRIIEAEHRGNDTWYFYPLSMIGCVFPWSLFLLISLIFLPKTLKQPRNHFYLFLTCWIGIVFLVFQFAHSKLTSYILPIFPALSLATGDFIINAFSDKFGRRIIFFILLANFFILLLIPIGIIIGSYIYSGYVPSKTPVYAMVIIFLSLAGTMLFFILRNKLLKGAYTLILVIPAFLCIVPFAHNYVEQYLSSKGACEYLINNYTVNNTILCSKDFVRGVRYYTDRDVAVLAISGKPFFSLHPIPFLNSDQNAIDFLHRRPITYCMVKKNSVSDIERIADKEFKYTLLNTIGSVYVLKIEQSLKPFQTNH